MRSAIVIPARLASTRLPRKLLLSETGKSVLQHTYESALKSRRADRVIIAADDPELVRTAESFGGQVVLTDANHQSGTDRVAEVACSLEGYDLIVNVQGDEPEIAASAIDLAIELLEADEDLMVSTLATPIRDRETLESPNCVKVVLDQRRRALYFSRSPIPFPRHWDDRRFAESSASFLQHVGLYAYRREFLGQLSRLPPSPLEQIESLEQLRFLAAGFPIGVGLVEHAARGIDTREDYDSFVSRALS